MSEDTKAPEEPEYRQEKEVEVVGKLQLTDEQFVEVFSAPDTEVEGDVQPGGGDPELKGYDPEDAVPNPNAPDYVYEGHDDFPDSNHEGDVQPGTPSEEQMLEDDEAPPVDGWDEATPAEKKAPSVEVEPPPNKLRESYLANQEKEEKK